MNDQEIQQLMARLKVLESQPQPSLKDSLIAEQAKLNAPEWWENPRVLGAGAVVMTVLLTVSGIPSRIMQSAVAESDRRAEQAALVNATEDAEFQLEEARRLDAVARERMHVAEMPVANGQRDKYARISPETQLLDPETGAPLANRPVIDPGGMSAWTDENGYPRDLAQVLWKEGERLEWLRERIGDDNYAAVFSNFAVEYQEEPGE